MFRKFLAVAMAGALLSAGLLVSASPVNAQAAAYNCAPGSPNWFSWQTSSDLRVAGNYCPGNGNATVEGSWAAWDKSSDGLCAEIYVSPNATGGFQRVPGTKACGVNVIRIVDNTPVPLSYVYRARVVKVYTTCPAPPLSCWVGSGLEIFNQGA